MARQKRKKFAENEQRDNIIQPGKPLFEHLKGQWNASYFKNDNPIVLELGCGRGEYSIGLAREYPDKNFIGVDIKGDRMFKGSGLAIEESLKNVAFLRIMIQDLYKHFESDEVSEIWVTFPDPRPKDRDEKRRLTAPRFFNMYYDILKNGGLFHLKTDNRPLFEYTLEIIKSLPKSNLIHTFDLYKSEYFDLHHGISTRYEKKFMDLGFSINYLRFNIISD